jgi:hypothetical protein
MAIGCRVSYCCALEEETELISLYPIAVFLLYVCSYNPQSMKSPVTQMYMYLYYILVITYMFGANVQVIITSYLNHKEYNVVRFEQMESLQAVAVNMHQNIS